MLMPSKENSLRDMSELSHIMKEEVQNISEWMRANESRPNPKKTEYMLIGHPRRINKIQTLAPVRLNGLEIKRGKN